DEAAAARLSALSDPLLRKEMAPYFVGSISDSVAIGLLDSLGQHTRSPMIHYFRARIALRQKRYGDAVAAFGAIHDSLAYPVLQPRKEELLGEALFTLREYQEARAHLWQSLNFQPFSAERVNDWLQRCEWFERFGARYLGK